MQNMLTSTQLILVLKLSKNFFKIAIIAVRLIQAQHCLDIPLVCNDLPLQLKMFHILFPYFRKWNSCVLQITENEAYLEQTIASSFHRKGKPQQVILKGAGFTQRAVFNRINGSLVEGKNVIENVSKQKGEHNLKRTVKQNPFKKLKEFHKQ